MPWLITANEIGYQPITTLETVAKHPLGTTVRAYDPTYGVGLFQYVKGVASCAVRNWVGINSDDWTLTRATTNGVYPIGIAMAALTASYYGWVQRSGKALGSCLTLFADNGKVYLTGTAGSIDDASVAGERVLGARGASATTVDSGYAEFEIDMPFVADGPI